MKQVYFSLILLFSLAISCTNSENSENEITSGNPILEGWYADPEGIVFGDEYWIYPTFSAKFKEQLFLDAFSSKDLVNWEKHEKIIDTTIIKWAKQAIWAPSIIKKDSSYFLFFAANDIQRPGRDSYDPNNPINHTGGIGIAQADSPSGPFKDYLGKPLISEFYNDAQPIDQFVFKDTDGAHYMFYGGWSHCNVGILNDDFTDFIPWEDGTKFKEITPEGYVEGPFMFKKEGKYYFMWSEGGWGNDSYQAAYATSDSPIGPFKKEGVILKSDTTIATGAGHHSVIKTPNTEDYYIIYHRRPIPSMGRDHRVTCIDKLEFEADGKIKPIKMTNEGVAANPIKL